MAPTQKHPIPKHIKSVSDIDWQLLSEGRKYHPSPVTWEDEVVYFLLVDRFSDGKEFGGFRDAQGSPVGQAPDRSTPRFQFPTDQGNADWSAWFDAGQGWCGGTLKGLADKLGYLHRLGVSALWVSPVFKQVTGANTYHGYAIQDFLDVDKRYGTREDFKSLVEQAHHLGIRVILDIVLNHSGDVWSYPGDHEYVYSHGQSWTPQGFRKDVTDSGTLPFAPLPQAGPDEGIWPAELQDPDAWSRQGQIRNWDTCPEYLDGDFFGLKNIEHGWGPKDPAMEWDLQKRIQLFQPASALDALIQVYKFWISYADLDGYRIDTVKHMEPGAVRQFCIAIHEHAQSLGKENFLLVGEVTGGRARAVDTVNCTGLDAALGIDDIQDKLEFLAKGWRNPSCTDGAQTGYFDLFSNSVVDGLPTHKWFGRHVFTMFDDHDQVGVDYKYRFCGKPGAYAHLRAALALNLLTAGIPCLYYGTEQALNGADPRQPVGNDKNNDWSDAFLRECMFGGNFGSFQSKSRHFFDEDHEIYKFMKSLADIRSGHLALKRGRQYLRQLSSTGNDGDFWYPQLMGGELRYVVAWSRLHGTSEMLVAVNTDPHQAITTWVTLDSQLHPAGSSLAYLLSTDKKQEKTTVTAQARNGSAVQITVPAAGVVVLG